MRGSTFLPNSSSARMSGSRSPDPGGCRDRSRTPAPTTVATAPDLLDDRVGAPDERRRQRAGHHRRARLARDVAGVERHDGVADAGAHGERRLVRLRAQQRVRLLVGLGHEHVRPVDDLLGRRLPAVARALLAVVPRGLGHDLERPVGHAAAEMVARGELARLAARPERERRRMRAAAAGAARSRRSGTGSGAPASRTAAAPSTP